MLKFRIVSIAICIACVAFAACDRKQRVLKPALAAAVDVTAGAYSEPDVVIYTGATAWITQAHATIEAEITRDRLRAAALQAEITEGQEAVKEWMLHTTADGFVNVLIVYGVLPTTIYGLGNTEPDGSVAENWIETSDGNTILNQADYLGWNSSVTLARQPTDPDYGDVQYGWNGADALKNLMDLPDIELAFADDRMRVTADGAALTPSLGEFVTRKPFVLNGLQGEWFAEKVFASDTGKAHARLADPVIVRDGTRGRLAIVLATQGQDDPKGEVAAEIILNYLLKE